VRDINVIPRLRAVYHRAVPISVRTALYESLHPECRLERVFYRRAREAIRSYLERAARKHWLEGMVLEIGSGRESFCRDVFVKYSPSMQFLRSELSSGGYGQSHSPDGNAGYDLYCDVTRLGVRDGCLDGIICSEVLEHVPDYPAALCEVARVLRSGGRFLITSPFLYPLHGPVDFWRFTPQALRQLLDPWFEIKDLSLAPFQHGTLTFPVNIGVLAERK
jgi:SAM-dependent methyltransferase